MLKLYEEFVKYDKLYEIIQQLENRIKYWFSDKGTLGKDTNLVQIDSTLTNKYTTRTIITTFNNENYMYQCLFTVAADNADKCKVTLKRYGLDDQNLIDKIEEEIDLNNVKEDFIINKMSDLEGKNDNPDKNKIQLPKEDKPQEDNEPQGNEPQGNEPQDNEPQFNLGGPGGGFEEEEEF